MYYSITFTNSSGAKKNTWDDWQMIPTAPPQVEAPEVYTNYVDIPGRTAGPIDLSEALSGRPTFLNSEGDWEFVLDADFQSRPIMYQELKNFLHGRMMKIELEEDPLHYYNGRISVSAPKTSKSNATISLHYNIVPIRYNSDGTQDGV